MISEWFGRLLTTGAAALIAAAPLGAQTILQVPSGYKAEKVVDGLNFPTGLTWDDQGRVYVAEAGGALFPEQKRPIRILRVENGRATPITGDLAGSGVNVAPPSWGDMAGQLFIAEWGDLAPPTNPVRGKEPAGSRVVRVNPTNGQLEPFVWNRQPGPASMQNARGRGLDRPFNVTFGPDGAMYIVEYGVVKIDMSLTKQGKPPYNEVPGTGAIWRVVPANMPMRRQMELERTPVRKDNM